MRTWLCFGALAVGLCGCSDSLHLGASDLGANGLLGDLGAAFEQAATAAPADMVPTCATVDGGSGCYVTACRAAPHMLAYNRDRLGADLAKRKCTDTCTLWAALNKAERYVFLKDTAYLGAAFGPTPSLAFAKAAAESYLARAAALLQDARLGHPVPTLPRRAGATGLA